MANLDALAGLVGGYYGLERALLQYFALFLTNNVKMVLKSTINEH